MANNQEFGPVAAAKIEISGEDALNKIRSIRKRILENEVDPLIMNPLRWNDLSELDRNSIIAYRQALLDMPENYPNAKYIWSNEHMRFVEDNFIWPELNLGE